MTAPLAIIRDPEVAGAALSPIRKRILGSLSTAGSATTVGERLGMGRQKVNYHLRALESAGLVEHVEDRRKGNCTERVVRATATHYLVDPSVLGPLADDPHLVADAFSSERLAAVSARTVTQIAELRDRAAAAGKRLPTYSLETAVRFASAADQAAFLERLSKTVTDLVAEYHDADARGGRWFRLVAGSHPALRVPETNDDDPEEAS